MMKKSLLALAVAALSVNAFAAALPAVDLDAKPIAPDTFASEIVIKSSGTTIGTNNVSAKAKVGFVVTSGFVRVDLSNGATFDKDPSLAGGTGTNKIVSGGDGQSFAIFSDVTTATATDTLTVAGATLGGIKVVNQDAVNVTFGVYETASNAATQTTPLNSKSGTLLNFKPAMTVKAEQGDKIGKIAIGETGKNFLNFTSAVSDTESNILDLTVDINTDYLDIDGSNLLKTDIITDYSLTVNGNFGAAGKVTVNATNATLAADKLSATLDKQPVSATAAEIDYTVDGATVIPESQFSVTFTPEVAANYAVSAKTFSNIANLQRDGSSDTADLVLKPNGAYRNFVRISNTSSVAGKFFLEVTNDDGQSVTFGLGEVEGQPASLNAGASTTQMSIEQIYAAAQANGLQLTGEGKLRLKASGQVSNGGVSLQTYTTSKDGNSFASF